MNGSIITNSGIVVICIYILSLLLIGYLGKKASREYTLSDFFLAGRNMGFFVLFLTLYATQYSGNTLIGFAGKAYREGFMTLVSVTFMMSVIGAYLLFAPKLYRLSKKEKFITIGDYFQYRFKSRLFTSIAVIICVIALGNYILTNLKAIGYIVEIVTDSKVSFATGIIALSVIMVIYESLGGLRSVAWTDVIQGLFLLFGCIFILLTIEYQYGGITKTSQFLIETKPQYWVPPTGEMKISWLSTLLIVFFSMSLYPHAIQRIYAAKDEKTLKKSFKVMVFMPLVTTFVIVMVGIIGITQFPDLDKNDSERIVILILEQLKSEVPLFGIVLTLFIAAAIAAIMSTIDSALLAISSLFTQDFYRIIRPQSTDKHLTSMGKISSWIIMALMCYLAIILPQTIWKLMVIKFEILCQIAPAVFLGLHISSINSRSMIYGITVGTLVTLFILFNEYLGLNLSTNPFGVHAGMIGLSLNFLTILIHHKTFTATKN